MLKNSGADGDGTVRQQYRVWLPAKCQSVEQFRAACVNDDDAVIASRVHNPRLLVRRGEVAAEIHAASGVSERQTLRVVRLHEYKQHLHFTAAQCF